MITLYQHHDTINTVLYTFSDKEADLSVHSWDSSIQEALNHFISKATTGLDHSTFDSSYSYIILGAFDSLSPTFMEDHPELFI